MRFVRQCVEIFEQPSCSYTDIAKQIERCGRICYKSEDKVTETSAVPFLERMVASNHLAMCEHGTVYLKILIGSPVIDDDKDKIELKSFFMNNHFSRLNRIKYKEGNYIDDDEADIKQYVAQNGACNVYYITTNYRVLLENNLLEKCQEYICEKTDKHTPRVTVHFVTDRGVWNESIRHRSIQRTDDGVFDIVVDYETEKEFSFAQESTRYCNYARDKFNHELTFVIPSWFKSMHSIKDIVSIVERPWRIWENLYKRFSNKYPKRDVEWVKAMKDSENRYFNMIEFGCKPEEARTALNNSLKTELIMSGFVDETGWLHFFDLRYLGKTGKPQKEMKDLATMTFELFEQNDLIPSEYYGTVSE